MRDILVALIVVAILPFGIFHPWIGAMEWAWVSLMSPHRLGFGFMHVMPVAMATGAVTLIGLVFSKDPKRLPIAPPVVMLIAFSLWMVITFFFSLVDTPENLDQLDKVMKVNLMTLVTIAVVHSRKQVDVLIAVCALSVALLGAKGGIFTITTGGEYRVWGVGGFIKGNNEFALATVMVVPLMYYLATIAPNKWLKRLSWVILALCVISSLGSQSRGALLAVLAMVVAFLLRTPKAWRLVLPFGVLSGFIVMFMPDSWWDRMNTINTYEQDESAMGRINAWTVAWNVARANFFGGGFNIEFPEIFAIYAPNPNFIAVAHSIYFQVLGHHGFVGLFLYLLFWFATFLTGRWISKHSPDDNDRVLVAMIETSLAGFAVGGAFLNLAYFDGPYYLMAALVIVRYKILNNQKRPPRRPGMGPSTLASGRSS